LYELLNSLLLGRQTVVAWSAIRRVQEVGTGMKLLQLCVAVAMAAGVMAGSHPARAQALGEAATLGAGVSSAGSASGSALGNSLARAMRSDGRRINSSGNTSNSGGVVNLHWSREELKHSARAMRTQAKGNHAKVASGKSHPDFVIFGADPPNADSADASDSQPKATHSSATEPKSSENKGSSGQGGKSVIPASH